MSHAGLHTSKQFFKDDPGDRRHIEVSGFLDRHPDQLNQFGVGADHTLDGVSDRRSVRRQEAGVEAARPPGWRDRTRDKMDLPEVRVNIRFGEFRPDLAWDFRRTVTFDTEQEAGLFSRLAHRGQPEGTRKIAVWLRHSLQKFFLSVRVQLTDRGHLSVERFAAAAGKNELSRYKFVIRVACAI